MTPHFEDQTFEVLNTAPAALEIIPIAEPATYTMELIEKNRK